MLMKRLKNDFEFTSGFAPQICVTDVRLETDCKYNKYQS